MNEIFVCGFNGFRQCDGLSAIFSCSLCDENGRLAAGDTDVNPECLKDAVSEGECQEYDLQSVTKEDNGQGRERQGAQPPWTKTGNRKRKLSEEANIHVKDAGRTGSKTCALKSVCRYSHSRLKLENITVMWSRIVADICLSSSVQKCVTHHTLVSGYSAETDKAHPLHIHLPDTRLLGNTCTDLLLQRQDDLLVLQEAASQPMSAAVSAVDAQDDQNVSEFPVKLGAVSGTASEFVVCYDGISVGKLEVKKSHQRVTSEDSDGASIKLWLTPLDSGVSVKQVSCGLEHTLLLTQHGGVLTFGSGSRGQLGNGSLETEAVQQMVAALEGLRIVSVAAGGWHSAAVSESGDLYMWGWNESGQLGLPCPNIQEDMTLSQQQEPHKDLMMSMERAASLHLWPVCVDVGSDGTDIKSVACGTRHSAVVTCDGRVYTTGWNKYSQLGHCHQHSIDRFTQVVFPSERVTVEHVWCGAWNSVFQVRQVESGQL